jgi:hypothetical protein
MNKDAFSDNAKAPGKNGDTTKSSTSNTSQVRPSPSGPRPPVPQPSFGGPIHVAVNIKPLPAVVKPAQESTVTTPEETKDK